MTKWKIFPARIIGAWMLEAGGGWNKAKWNEKGRALRFSACFAAGLRPGLCAPLFRLLRGGASPGPCGSPGFGASPGLPAHGRGFARPAVRFSRVRPPGPCSSLFRLLRGGASPGPCGPPGFGASLGLSAHGRGFARPGYALAGCGSRPLRFAFPPAGAAGGAGKSPPVALSESGLQGGAPPWVLGPCPCPCAGNQPAVRTAIRIWVPSPTVEAIENSSVYFFIFGSPIPAPKPRLRTSSGAVE